MLLLNIPSDWLDRPIPPWIYPVMLALGLALLFIALRHAGARLRKQGGAYRIALVKWGVDFSVSRALGHPKYFYITGYVRLVGLILPPFRFSPRRDHIGGNSLVISFIFLSIYLGWLKK